MIKNEKQYKIAKAKLQKWLQNLQIHASDTQKDLPEWIVREQGVSIREQVIQLQAEVKEYEDTLASGTVELPDLAMLEEVPALLIKWRIACRLTQRDLASLAGIHENLLQKYEQENYSGASLKTILHIARVLKSKGQWSRAQ